MLLTDWLLDLTSASRQGGRHRRSPDRRPAAATRLEALEDRTLLSSTAGWAFSVSSNGAEVTRDVNVGPDDHVSASAGVVGAVDVNSWPGTVDVGTGWTQEPDEMIGAGTDEAVPQGADTLKVQVVATAEIHGQKWNDVDGDGARDSGEPGLNGWVIELFDDQGAQVATQTTADRDLDGNGMIDPETERGLYSFTDLVAGTYTIGEVLQAGWEQTSPDGDPLPDPNSWNVEKLSQRAISDFPGGNTAANDVTGYVSPSGREYAIIGLSHGTGYVEVTDPAHPVIVAFIPGADEPSDLTGEDPPGHTHAVAKNFCSTDECEGASTWRDIKTFGQHAYVTNETGGGLQIIDLSQIDSGIVSEVSTLTAMGLRTAHNIAINPDSGFAYLTGANIASGGLVVVDLGSNPAAPTIVGTWAERYIHDAVIISYTSGPAAGREIAYGFAGRFGVKVVDVTNKSDMITLATVPYPNVTYAHFGTLSEDLQYLFVNDELDERDHPDVTTTTTYVLDVSTPASPVYITSFTNGLPAIDHNLEARGDFLFEANYRSGLRVFDVSDVSHVQETGFYDTYPADDKAAFAGAWGVYPDLPSGVVLVSDMQSGLFVLDTSAATGVHTTRTVLVAPGEIVTGIDFGNHRPFTPTIIDDGDDGYSDTGNWGLSPLVEGREEDVRFAPAGNGSRVANWMFSGLTPGMNYEVSATWTAHPNRATNAPYTVLDSDGVSVLEATLVNQKTPPNDFSIDGSDWEKLGVVTVNGATLTVQLSNAADRYVIADAVRLEQTAETPPQVVVIDDGDVSYSDRGWNVSPMLEGRLNDIRYRPAGSGGETATWTFTGLTPGNYTVAATWPAHSNRATNTPFSIYDSIGGDMLEIMWVDQKRVPDDFFDNGSSWENLAVVTITGSALVVELSDDANGFVIADAIRIEPTTVASLPPGTIIDDGDAGFSTTGSWNLTPVTEGRGGDVRYTGAGDGSRIAAWTFTGLAAGLYRVSATWSAHINRATNAPYTIFDGDAAMAAVDVNQRQVPNDFSTLGSDWEDLMTVEITSGTLVVELSNAADGFVIADAIRLQPLA